MNKELLEMLSKLGPIRSVRVEPGGAYFVEFFESGPAVLPPPLVEEGKEGRKPVGLDGLTVDGQAELYGAPAGDIS